MPPQDTADRSLQRVEESVECLARHPGIGTTLSLGRPELAGMRKWQVKEFDDVLICCLPGPDDLTI